MYEVSYHGILILSYLFSYRTAYQVSSIVVRCCPKLIYSKVYSDLTVCLCLPVRLCTCACVYVCVHVYVYVCACVSLYVCAHAHVRMCV